MRVYLVRDYIYICKILLINGCLFPPNSRTESHSGDSAYMYQTVCSFLVREQRAAARRLQKSENVKILSQFSPGTETETEAV